jgi:hypothetical protein
MSAVISCVGQEGIATPSTALAGSNRADPLFGEFASAPTGARSRCIEGCERPSNQTSMVTAKPTIFYAGNPKSL